VSIGSEKMKEVKANVHHENTTIAHQTTNKIMKGMIN
jgi:hypothetical protein